MECMCVIDPVWGCRATKEKIRKLLAQQENLETFTDCEEFRRQGAISVLEELLNTFEES